MSARCPDCGHGTSGCLFTEEQWDFIREAVDNCVSNLGSYDGDREEMTGVDDDEYQMMVDVAEKLGSAIYGNGNKDKGEDE